MCMFCAAIPMSASVGVTLARKQKARLREVNTSDEKPLQTEAPIGRITFVVTGSLVVCSAVYHLVIMPRVGMIV
jgi:hypothetical protein